MKSSNLLRNVLATVASALVTALSFATCVSNSGPVGVSGTFTPDASGEILTYSGTGLQYTRCQLGSSGPLCTTGAPLVLTWQQALQASVTSRIGGFDDWRVPNLQELAAIIEPTCFINALPPDFPAATGGVLWTSTSYALSGDGAWYVNAFGGTVSATFKSSARGVILVRGNSTPAGNFDSLPAAIVSLTPSTATTSQNTPFDVVVSIPTAGTSVLGVSLNIATQPAGPAGSLTGSVFCSIPAGNTSCTVAGVELSGPAGQYTLSASTAGGPAGGVIVNASAPINLLAGPTATIGVPASATQFAPFNMVIILSQAATANVTFEVVRTGGPVGTLGGTTTCTIPASATSCSFPSVTFSGYGTGLFVSANVISGPSIPPPTNQGFDVDPQPVNIAMGAQASQIVNVGFSTVFSIDIALPIAITMSSQVAAGGPAGTFVPANCVIPAGSLVCSATGNTFSGVGLLFLEPIILSSSSPVLVQSTNTASIDIVNQGGTLSAPATATQFAPFNVTLTLAAGAAATTTFTLAQASGPAGTLGGGTTCTITTGNLTCTFTGVTFSGSGPAVGLTATATSGPATPVLGTSLDITAVTYTISPIAPASAPINAPFNVTLQSTQPVAFDIPFTISVVNGAGGVLGGGTGCTILTGQTSCTITGVTYSALGAITVIANTTVGGVAFAYEQGAFNIVAAPVASVVVPVPTLPMKYLLILCMLVGLMATMRRRHGA
jgi:Protein of unknown function (DUF1566)